MWHPGPDPSSRATPSRRRSWSVVETASLLVALLLVAGLCVSAAFPYLRHRAWEREVVRSVQAESVQSTKADQAQADADAKAAREAHDQLSRDKKARDDKLTAAAAVKTAQTEAQQRTQAAKPAAAKSARIGCLYISKECFDNPLSKSCE